MNKLRLTFSLLLAVAGKMLLAQPAEIIVKYVAAYKDAAIAEMQRTGVPASITLAQGIHETMAGTSDLVLSSNNHFGIKCKAGWTGASVSHDDDAKGECFRKYDSPFDSYRDHSDFLKNSPRYATLFSLDPTDYESWAQGLKKAGYATNPKYPQILCKLIKDYNLQDYTFIAMNRAVPDRINTDLAKADGPPVVIIETAQPVTAETMPPPVAITVPLPSYPSGVFKINDTRVIFMTQGTAYLKIAEEAGLRLPLLFEFNDMKPADVAAADGLLYLQRKRKTGANEFHTVARGETLYDIAQAEAIRIESLLEYNFLRTGMQPQVGEKLYLFDKAPAMPRLAAAAFSASAVSTSANTAKAEMAPSSEPESYTVYVVQPKETMYAIAKKFSVGVEDVMKWNGMASTDLKTGQELRINKRMAGGIN